MRIGAHVSSAGGPAGVFERGAKIGAEALQIFLSAPQQWRTPAFSEEQIAGFKTAHTAAGIPVFAHGVYLMNFGSQDDALLGRSVASLAAGLRWADELGLAGTIFHAGSHLGAGFDEVLPAVCRLLRQALTDAPGESLLVIENSAGQGNCIGRSFAEIGAMIRGLDSDPRVAVCLDTCHALAMGYDVTAREGVEIAMTEFEREIGFGRLVAVHANDSKMPLGGVRDRHENIGDGHIGFAGFREIMRHPAFAEVPFLLEVPGIDGKGPDEENVNRLKRIRDGQPEPAPAAAGG